MRLVHIVLNYNHVDQNCSSLNFQNSAIACKSNISWIAFRSVQSCENLLYKTCCFHILDPSIHVTNFHSKKTRSILLKPEGLNTKTAYRSCSQICTTICDLILLLLIKIAKILFHLAIVLIFWFENPCPVKVIWLFFSFELLINARMQPCVLACECAWVCGFLFVIHVHV